MRCEKVFGLRFWHVCFGRKSAIRTSYRVLRLLLWPRATRLSRLGGSPTTDKQLQAYPPSLEHFWSLRSSAGACQDYRFETFFLFLLFCIFSDPETLNLIISYWSEVTWNILQKNSLFYHFLWSLCFR